MSGVLLELAYLPPVSHFALMEAHPIVMLEQYEHYSKGSYRNRCHIAGSQGPLRLTVPLRKGKNRQQPIREVGIAYDEPWQSRHWQAIRSAYGKSPYFLHYSDVLEPFFKEKRFDFLWDLNSELLKLLLGLLRLNFQLEFSHQYEVVASPGILDFRNAILPDQPLPDALPPLRPYSQVFEDRLGFTPNLSVIDLLFCMGPASRDYLSAARQA
ncbi:MAG: hypothetical protein RI973_1405 [Bacteroidota bacterium]|jgi:hypothetical protein